MLVIPGRSLVFPAALVFSLMACASGKPNPASGSQAGKGFRTLDAVVVERSFEPSSVGSAGGGVYYMGFEAKDGEATVHYRFPVTRVQYNRFSEGDHVQLWMADDRLRDVRPAP